MADLGSERTEVQQETAYGAQSDGGAKPGFALSAWSLVIGGVFLVSGAGLAVSHLKRHVDQNKIQPIG